MYGLLVCTLWVYFLDRQESSTVQSL